MKSLQTLKDQGFKITPQRENIFEVLSSAPQSAEEIFDKLKKKRVRIDLVSIYRTLELFFSMGIVHEVFLSDGVKRYEFSSEHNHHHHLVCNSCGRIDDISLPEEKLIKEVSIKTSFRVENHSLEFFGVCQSCQ